MDYREMKKEERDACAELAARAFDDYEYFTVYFPRGERRYRFLRSMIDTEFRVNDGLEVFLTAKEGDRTVAAAILCRPGYIKPSAAAYLRGGFWKSMLYGGFRDVSAWDKMEYEAFSPCREMNRKDAWYLNMLVVSPDRKGEGIGSRMLQECLIPYVKEHGGQKLCLFTNSQGNRQFYRKNGFTEFDERQFAYKGKTIGSWSLQKIIQNLEFRIQNYPAAAGKEQLRISNS